jgi:hypothetical protein
MIGRKPYRTVIAPASGRNPQARFCSERGVKSEQICGYHVSAWEKNAETLPQAHAQRKHQRRPIRIEAWDGGFAAGALLFFSSAAAVTAASLRHVGLDYTDL